MCYRWLWESFTDGLGKVQRRYPFIELHLCYTTISKVSAQSFFLSVNSEEQIIPLCYEESKCTRSHPSCWNHPLVCTFCSSEDLFFHTCLTAVCCRSPTFILWHGERHQLSDWTRRSRAGCWRRRERAAIRRAQSGADLLLGHTEGTDMEKGNDLYLLISYKNI